MPFAKDLKWMPFKEIKWSLKIGENNIRGFWQKWTLSEAKNKIVFSGKLSQVESKIE